MSVVFVSSYPRRETFLYLVCGCNCLNQVGEDDPKGFLNVKTLEFNHHFVALATETDEARERLTRRERD